MKTILFSLLLLVCIGCSATDSPSSSWVGDHSGYYMEFPLKNILSGDYSDLNSVEVIHVNHFNKIDSAGGAFIKQFYNNPPVFTGNEKLRVLTNTEISNSSSIYYSDSIKVSNDTLYGYRNNGSNYQVSYMYFKYPGSIYDKYPQ